MHKTKQNKHRMIQINHIIVQYLVLKKIAPPVLQLKKWAKKALEGQKKGIEMTIRIVDTQEITDLNTQYRKKPYATNVLSFPYDISMDLTGEPPLLGDIVICAAIVNQEAQDQGKPATAHWAHMVVHGTLHLLGYDHETLADANKMEPLEIKILKELGFPNPYQYR